MLQRICVCIRVLQFICMWTCVLQCDVFLQTSLSEASFSGVCVCVFLIYLFSVISGKRFMHNALIE